MAKTKEQLLYLNKILKVCLIVIGIGFIISCLTVNYFENKVKGQIVYHEDLYESLTRIQKNCGSTFITTRFNEPGLFVFTEVCKDNNYCKHDYISIEECLKNVRIS